MNGKTTQRKSTNELEPRALNDRQTAHYIGMSESWLRQSRMTGRLDTPPYAKIGRAVRYLREDLDDWLDSRRRPVR